MKIKAMGFDIGGTLVNYNKPLNWSASYQDAIKYMCLENRLKYTEKRFEQAREVLQKYNTRINPREKEITSDTIFGEIFAKWGEDKYKIYPSKKSFYLFFQGDANLYEDAKSILEFCKNNDIKCAVYTDVAYGMDDEFSLKDIEKFNDYIDLKLTSENVGYRKPNSKGFKIMLEKFNCNANEMIYIGDEEKDIIGAISVNMKSVLINRKDMERDFKQDYTVKNLTEVIDIVKRQ